MTFQFQHSKTDHNCPSIRMWILTVSGTFTEILEKIYKPPSRYLDTAILLIKNSLSVWNLPSVSDQPFPYLTYSILLKTS